MSDPEVYEIGQLYPGCSIRTPLSRWERIIRIGRDPVRPWLVRVVTDRCAAGYGWTFMLRDRFETTFPRTTQPQPTPEVRLVDGPPHAERMLIMATYDARTTVPSTGRLAESYYQAADDVWSVNIDNGDGTTTSTTHPTKEAARDALRAAGRHHAKNLGVRYCEQQERHHHNGDDHD